MIFFSIGLPGRFAEWCDRLVLRLVEHRGESVASVALNRLDELAIAAIRTRRSNLIACCRQPVLQLQSEIARAEVPFVLTLGDPRTAVREQVARMGCTIADATRAVASSCAMMLTMARTPQALVLTDADAGNLPEVAAAIAAHFEIAISEGEAARLASELAEPGSKTVGDEDASWFAGLSGREQAIVRGALDPYVTYFDDDDVRRLVWESELFYISEEPIAPALVPATRPVDLTGRPRFVVYGPFINLPPGAWSADVVLGFSAEAAGNSMAIEVFAGAQLAQARLDVSGEQVSDIRLDFIIAETADQPVQIRIVNERAAFDGRLAVGYVALTRQAAVPEETRARLESALRPEMSPVTP
ncbi:MAG TPA: hypothetical protein VME41_16195 [Stellaceae bacterium]|nr:hypothetical protein [Stellaceae bacterium]